MKVLWITNILFPEARALLCGENVTATFGGWMTTAAEGLLTLSDEIELSVASVSDRVSELTRLEGEKIRYYIMPNCTRIDKYDYYMKKICQEAMADVVHIHGTEFPYGYSWIKSCPTANVVVSIQGMVSVISKYYLAGLSKKEVIFNITVHDLLRNTIRGEQKLFYKRGKLELEVIKNIKHVIGRTSFDYAHCKAINPSINYHYCGETLRKEFYTDRWTYEQCTPHTIFLSQTSYPIKGLHMVLYALPIIIRQFPDVHIRIAGDNIIQCNNIRSFFRLTGYGRVIRKIIKVKKLGDRITFTGPLTTDEMKREYLKANVFICPSSIENSPNSLGEAQVLGTPVVASFVGGIPDMMRGDESMLYRFEEYEMLAEKVCAIFKSKSNIDTLTMRNIALKRHDAEENATRLLNIYKDIIK